MIKKWEIAKNVPDTFKKRFKDLDDVVIQMLYNRQINEVVDAQDFFHPEYEKMHDPFLLKDMDKAVKRIIHALDTEENIMIFGDYDVDGITSTAVIFKILKKLKAKVDFYIPHRMQEGYGLNKKALDFFARKNIDLIITVDSGISNREEVAYAKKIGIDVIVTDHHEPPKNIPSAIAVINPKRKDCKYPFKDLAGVGVAFKLALALVRQINDSSGKEIISEGSLKWYLDLVALGTISDIVPLLGENRIMTHYGLIVLSKTKNLGLKSLGKVVGIDLKGSNPYMIGFQIAPRLNAAGRMDHATTALELLLTHDEGEAGVLAMKLEKLNRDRQETIMKNINELKDTYSGKTVDSNIIILKDKRWTSGIIGLIAGRMSEEFSRPVFCIAEENGILKGSVRSSVEFNVIETLSVFEKVFINYGGHRGAGGFSLNPKDFDIFYDQVTHYSKVNINQDSLIPKIFIEKEISFNQIDQDLFREIKKFEPFGHENSDPLFVTFGVKVKEAKKVGKENAHTKLKLIKDGKEFGAILFNHGEMGDQLYYGKDIDIVYKITENEWNGKKNLELKIEDLK